MGSGTGIPSAPTIAATDNLATDALCKDEPGVAKTETTESATIPAEVVGPSSDALGSQDGVLPTNNSGPIVVRQLLTSQEDLENQLPEQTVLLESQHEKDITGREMQKRERLRIKRRF